MQNRIVVALFMVLLLATFHAEAGKLEFEYDRPVVSSRWGITLGGYLADLDTTAAVGVGGVVGTVIDLENILDLQEDQGVGRLDAFVRLAPKHTLDFGILQINREATAVLGGNIDFNGFRFSGNLDSTFDMTQFKTIYKYSFINNGQVNAGISTGLSWFRLGMSLSGNATALDDQGMPVGSASLDRVGETVLAPIPSLGMFVEYAPVRWFIVTLEGQFFDLEVGDLDFRFTDTSILLDFYVTKHFGIGIGTNTTSLEYRDTGDNPINVEYRYGGVLFHLGIAF